MTWLFSKNISYLHVTGNQLYPTWRTLAQLLARSIFFLVFFPGNLTGSIDWVLRYLTILLTTKLKRWFIVNYEKQYLRM